MEEFLEKKILIVDDSSMSLALLKTALKKLGFNNIHSFLDSVEAWEAFAESQLSDNPFDLVMTDLNMPGLDGMDFASQIKGDDMSRETKIIIVSADADPLVIDEAMSHGVEEYIVKPLDLDVLKDKIEFVFKGLPFEISE